MSTRTLMAGVIAIASFGWTIASASAAPATFSGVSTQTTDIVQVRMSRRRARRMSSGNSKDPSRSPRQQNRGQTSGGPRY